MKVREINRSNFIPEKPKPFVNAFAQIWKQRSFYLKIHDNEEDSTYD